MRAALVRAVAVAAGGLAARLAGLRGGGRSQAGARE